MSDKKLTPEAVKKIESALEERKPKSDRRRGSNETPPSGERRAGKDRRSQ